MCIIYYVPFTIVHCYLSFLASSLSSLGTVFHMRQKTSTVGIKVLKVPSAGEMLSIFPKRTNRTDAATTTNITNAIIFLQIGLEKNVRNDSNPGRKVVATQ